MNSICGGYSFSCFQAFFSLADALPGCAQKMLDVSVWKQDGLELKGYKAEYDSKMAPYLPVLMKGYTNLLWLVGKEFAYGKTEEQIKA